MSSALSNRRRFWVSLVFATFLAFVCLTPTRAIAHTTPGGFTLHQLCRAADVIAIVRITESAKDASPSEPTLIAEAEIKQLLREGNAKKGKLRFVAHRHGEDNYAEGEEVILFLKQREKITKEEQILFESIDTITDRIVLQPELDKPWLDAVRAYESLGKGPRSETDSAALSKITVAMLRSEEPAISSLALRDLTLAGEQIKIAEPEVKEILALIERERRTPAFRTGIVIELERRKLIEVGPAWVKLLKSDRNDVQIEAIRAASTRTFVPAVRDELLRLTDNTQSEVAIAAIRALGTAGNDNAIVALEQAAQSDPLAKRLVAISSLRRIGTTAAKKSLKTIASTSQDPETRDSAMMELNWLGGVPEENATELPKQPPLKASSILRMAIVALLALASVAVAIWGRGKAK